MIVLRHPQSEAEIGDLVREARSQAASLRIQGGGTRMALGRPTQNAILLSTEALSGITLYEPSEMVIGAKAGTPIEEIEQALAEKGQMLAFEPADYRLLYGTMFSSLARDASGKPGTTFPHPAPGRPTIGAVAAGNISGPRRIWAGACRDSLIGVRFVNGMGETVKSGGRVMKNVTGLDLVKLQCGAWGTLGILTEVIFKVVPKPETVATLVLAGLDDAAAIKVMAAAVTSPFEITGAAHLPATTKSSEVVSGSRKDFVVEKNGVGGDGARTYLRIEGFAASVDYRAAELGRLLAPYGMLSRLGGTVGASVWTAIRDCAPLIARSSEVDTGSHEDLASKKKNIEPREAAIWRMSVKPSEAAKAVAAIRASRDIRAYYDWGGGLIWLATEASDDAGAEVIRMAAKAAKGYATLMRAPDAVRAVVPVFEPEPAPVAALTRRIKASVDPNRLINPGLMYAGV